MTAERHRFEVSEEDAGLRLDQVLSRRVPGLSRRRARVLLDLGGVYVDGRRVKVASRKPAVGQRIEAVIGGALGRATGTGAEARARELEGLEPRIVYEDEDIIVIDKPVGLLAAPSPEGDRGDAAGWLSRRGGGRAPILVVHRIDRPTSGLVVYARTEVANRELAARFRDHDIERRYLAVVRGAWPAELERIEEPIAGRAAISRFAVLCRIGDEATALEVELETGRTHQIRIHCAGAGHPVLGDRKYGGAEPGLSIGRLALHARVLGFVHPRTGEPLRFESPAPEPMATLIRRDQG
jgi:23S rRNA pseudouridine1911/1915/1917 synthase